MNDVINDLFIVAKALSSVPSTAAFDKNPQSRERGITLDLGENKINTIIQISKV